MFSLPFSRVSSFSYRIGEASSSVTILSLAPTRITSFTGSVISGSLSCGFAANSTSNLDFLNESTLGSSAETGERLSGNE